MGTLWADLNKEPNDTEKKKEKKMPGVTLRQTKDFREAADVWP